VTSNDVIEPMEEPRETDVHPFEQFKETMRKLVTVSKADLDAQLIRHAQTTHKKRPGRKPEQPKSNGLR
jgi:hypothetical protein